MQLATTVSELRDQLAHWRSAGQRVALVPTMGNLHAGHLRLVEHARALADRVVVSVFVNPLQFGANEDFGRYPRTLDADRQALSGAGADLLFAPADSEIYPRDRTHTTRVQVPDVTCDLEGAFRSGHFDGVSTVVSILFNLVQPDTALFGEKDYQQLQVIRRMVADLHMPIEIVGVATVRGDDGLALSSRNQYLTPAERAVAPRLYAALCTVAGQLKKGRRDYESISEESANYLKENGFNPQYLEIRRPDLGMPEAADRRFVVLVAAYLGATRLIDNLVVDEVPNP